MIYLDYAATTPIEPEVADTFQKAQKLFFANPDSLHEAGQKAQSLIQDAKKQMAQLLQVNANELFITSGATEANNMALFGAARAYKSRGNHIITTNIEHASVSKTLKQLTKEGFAVTFVPVNSKGIVQIEDVLKAITPQTILVSIMHINNEIGSIQPIEAIAQQIKQKNSKIIIHSDMAQSIGKRPIDLTNIDLATFSGHKFFAPKTIGICFKKQTVQLEPLLYGGQQENGLRPGTMNAALIAATAKAMRLAFERYQNLKTQEEILEKRQFVVNALKTFTGVSITLDHNDFNQVTPYIIHFQITDSKAQMETYLNALSNEGICLSTRSTCHSKHVHEANPILQALGYSAEASRRGIRVSISHMTTEAELQQFLQTLQKIMQDLKI